MAIKIFNFYLAFIKNIRIFEISKRTNNENDDYIFFQLLLF